MMRTWAHVQPLFQGMSSTTIRWRPESRPYSAGMALRPLLISTARMASGMTTNVFTHRLIGSGRMVTARTWSGRDTPVSVRFDLGVLEQPDDIFCPPKHIVLRVGRCRILFVSTMVRGRSFVQEESMEGFA